MTVTAAADNPRPLQRMTILCAAVTSSMFLLGWISFFFASSLMNLHENDIAKGLVAIATVQMASGIWGFVTAIRARRREGMHGALTATGIVTGLLFGVLGLLGIPLFLLFTSGSGIGLAGWGRPLRVRGKLVHPEVRVTRDWSRGEKPDARGLDAVTKEVLAALWMQDASKEYGSVPAFSRLGWQLAALGAPAELAERCYRAALEEIDHARRCFAIVEGYTFRATGAKAMPELLLDQPGFKSLRDGFRAVAIDSLIDGCLIEDLNADAAAHALGHAEDPAVRGMLEIIAREERSHAELAWDILAFCVREGGSFVRDAVEAELSRLPTTGPVPYDGELAQKVARSDAAALLAHGRVPFEMWPVLFERRRAETISRASALLGISMGVRAAA